MKTRYLSTTLTLALALPATLILAVGYTAARDGPRAEDSATASQVAAG